MKKENPQIYVACLAAYNNGILHGEWIDATQEIDDINQQIQAMLAASPIPEAEEYAIHDYDNFYDTDGVLGEYSSIETVHKVACAIQKHGKVFGKLFSHFSDVNEALGALENDYKGCYKEPQDYARELTKETTTIPDNLADYINYERMVQDWEYSGHIHIFKTAYDEYHVFTRS
jgi:antirestriction protein